MTRVIRSRRAGMSRQQPLYARLLGLQYLTPSGFLCFLFLEGALALGALLALAELVSWWGVLVLPVTVAAMVKLNDVVAGSVSGPAVPVARTAGGPAAGAWGVGGVRATGSGRGTGGRVGRQIGLRAAAGTTTGFDDFLDGAQATRPVPAAVSSLALRGPAAHPAAMGASAPGASAPGALASGASASEALASGALASGALAPGALPPEEPASGFLPAGAADPGAGTSADSPLEPWMPGSWMRDSRPPESAPIDPSTDPATPQRSAAEQSSPQLSTPPEAAPETWRPDTWAPDTWAPDTRAPDTWAPQTWTPPSWAAPDWASDPQAAQAPRAVTRTRSSTPVANVADASALNGPPASRQWASRAGQLDDPQQLARQAANRRYE